MQFVRSGCQLVPDPGVDLARPGLEGHCAGAECLCPVFYFDGAVPDLDGARVGRSGPIGELAGAIPELGRAGCCPGGAITEPGCAAGDLAGEVGVEGKEQDKQQG